MADHSQKRKNEHGHSDGRPLKMSKSGSGGRWKTPYQKARDATRIEMGNGIDVHDRGIWVTYARGMKAKAIREFIDVCEHYGKELYGLPRVEDGGEERSNEDSERDIIDSINTELESFKRPNAAKTQRHFTPTSSNIECVFFMKTKEPVEPDKLVLKICEDARDCQDPLQRKCKYINRLTPVVDTERATENGIDKIARRVLESHFFIRNSNEEATKCDNSSVTTSPDQAKHYSYAIRYNIRNHKTFRSSEIIQRIAAMIDPCHKVDLTNPDKVVLVEVYQLFCGMSVVDSSRWEETNRYNINEMYKLSIKNRAVTSSAAQETDQADKDEP